MTAASVETPAWSRRRWRWAIIGVLAGQAALIYLLEKAVVVPRQTVRVPQIHVRENVSLEQLAINDPTLFVRPHPRGFSGEAWLNHPPALNFQAADWTEPPRSLRLAPARLGANFQEFINANRAPHFETIPTVAPARSAPQVILSAPPPAPSSLRIEGALALRRLLTSTELPTWESNELAGSSAVQVLVDAAGRVISSVLLASSTGAKQPDADAHALALAQAARFESITNETPMLGTLLFDWQLLPLPATNAPTARP